VKHIDSQELLCTVLMFYEGRCVFMHWGRVHSHKLLSPSAWSRLLTSAYVRGDVWSVQRVESGECKTSGEDYYLLGCEQ
jgi:hypothetical protein